MSLPYRKCRDCEMEATHVVGDSGDELMWWACVDHLAGYEVICTKDTLEKLSADEVLRIMQEET